jgi:CubicO group peptidase (beta-lactamase class C family)
MFTKETDSIPSINQILNGESPATNDPVEIMFTPGSDHNYSNLGYIIIQKIIVDVLGKPFAQIIKELIFDPLGLQSSTFEYPEGDIAKNLSAPHDQEGKAHPPGLMHGASGHGGFLTNPAEFGLILLDLMKSYHDKPHKILSSETVHSMLTSQYTINPAQFFGWTGQGLGTFLIEENNQLFFTHPGTNAPGSTCMILCDVKQGKGVVLMANSINGELLNLRLLYALVKEYKWPKIWLFKNF